MRHITRADIQCICVHSAQGLAAIADLLTDLNGGCLSVTPSILDVRRQLLYTSSATVRDPCLEYLAITGGSSISQAASYNRGAGAILLALWPGTAIMQCGHTVLSLANQVVRICPSVQSLR